MIVKIFKPLGAKPKTSIQELQSKKCFETKNFFRGKNKSKGKR